MKITKLTANNFMRLTAVTITPDGAAVVIGGRNAAGKSSVLSSIEAALGGAKHTPSDPIKHGAKGARVVLETGDLVVTRTWSSKGSKLEVTSKDGSKFGSPQKMLDELVGSLSFDPSRFARMPPKEQAETLRALVGLDFAKEDAKRKEYFDQRTDVGRELRRLQGAIEKMPAVPAEEDTEEVSVAELSAELDRRRSVNDGHREKRKALADLRSEANSAMDRIKSLEKELAAAHDAFEGLNARGFALSAEVHVLVDEDLDAIRTKIATAEQTNAGVRARAERSKLQAELDAAIAESERLTQCLTQIDEVKASATASAKYPVEGLALVDDQVHLDGVPFEQASQAQRLRASTAIGLALNPELKVVLIRDGAYLDSEGLRLVAEMAEAAGGQVWVERVSEDGKGCTVCIEDGEVAEDRTGKGAA